VAVASLIRELPAAERPRERLLERGAQALSDAELVAILVRTGRPGLSALDLARDLLRAEGGLGGLATADAARLAHRGLGSARSAALLAAVEIGRRLAGVECAEREPMANPAAVASYLALRFGALDQEVFGALYLDTRNRRIGERELYRGALHRATVEPRRVLREGLLLGAAGCIAFHNHPSGDPTPSAEDLAFTRKLAEAGDAVGIRLVDHLIVGGVGRWVSLRDRGW
jgi:DNA repair protein RadC